jgi:putative ubiquitin-RnfH superfamily antitoxin RatB of RatAB toxin-antitoxin module
MSREEIEVEVVYALPLAQEITRLRIPAGTTVADAILRSAVAVRHPEIGAGHERVAIYGRVASADTVLHDKDRVEILRPLTADPKEARQQRASRQRRLPGRGKD